jgi:hypothetical protein
MTSGENSPTTSSGFAGPLANKKVQGCAVGCAAVLLIGILAVVGLYYWAVTPGTQVATDFILGADSLALMHVEGLQDDPGLSSMVMMLITELQTMQRARAQDTDIPWFVKMWMNRQREVGQKDVEKALRDVPRDMTVTVESVPEQEEPRFVGAVNLSRFPRMLQTAFWITSLFEETEVVDGFRLLSLDEGKAGVVTFIEQTLLWGQDSDALSHVLGRRTAALDDPSAHILRAYNSRDNRWDLYGVVENREEVLTWLISQWLKRDGNAEVDLDALNKELSGVVGAHFGVDVVDRDSIEGRLEVECTGESEATRYLEFLQSGVEEFLAEQDAADLEVTTAVEQDQNVLVVDLTISNIVDVVSRKLNDQ